MLFNNSIEVTTLLKQVYKPNKVKFQYLVCVIIHKLSHKSDHLINQPEITIKHKYLFDILILLPQPCQLIFHIFGIQNLSKNNLVFKQTLLTYQQIQRLFYIYYDIETLNQHCTLSNQILNFLFFFCFDDIQLIYLFINIEFPDIQFNTVAEHTVIYSTSFDSYLEQTFNIIYIQLLDVSLHFVI